MQIRLENIGIIKDSTLSLDGLTVVTGKNNSGKTTVGKALYSILDAVCNLRQKNSADKRFYIRNRLNEVADVFDTMRYIRLRTERQKKDFFADYSALSILFQGKYRIGLQECNEQFVRALVDELRRIHLSAYFDKESFLQKDLYRNFVEETEGRSSSFIDHFEKQQKQALFLLEKLLKDLSKDSELIDYARESINQTLQVEFAQQIQPVRADVPFSRIRLVNEDSLLFDLSIENNRVINDGTPVFFGSPFKRAYLIDNPFILEDSHQWIGGHGNGLADSETILNPSRINSHDYKLLHVLKENRPISVFEQTVLNHEFREVQKHIDNVIPGAFEFSSDGEFYVQNGKKLKIGNLATGSKMFSIVKILLEKGELDASTMLILDEPEAHLHPQWQNAFAEVIALFVKALNVNVLLTTHSPNFMLALDASMRKYDLQDKTNFYQTDVLEDGFVQYRCVNDDIGKIYQDFAKYLSEAKMLRNRYLYFFEE